MDDALWEDVLQDAGVGFVFVHRALRDVANPLPDDSTRVKNALDEVMVDGLSKSTGEITFLA